MRRMLWTILAVVLLVGGGVARGQTVGKGVPWAAPAGPPSPAQMEQQKRDEVKRFVSELGMPGLTGGQTNSGTGGGGWCRGRGKWRGRT